MKRTNLILFTVLLSSFLFKIQAQNPPTIGALENDTLFLGSGSNFLLIPNVDDGEAGSEQDITITALSDKDAVIEVTGVEYTAGNAFAVVLVDVKDSLATANISITADDGDGQANDNFDVAVVPYSKPGVNFEVFDVVFWREQNPFGLSPLFDTILGKAQFDTDAFNWDNVPLTVSADCGGQYCDGHDFATTMYWGYVVPPVSGDYIFTQHHQADNCLWLSTDDNFDNVQSILYKGDKQPEVGTLIDSQHKQSIPVTLTAGKVYAFYSVHWNIHFEDSEISWETAGLPQELITGQNLMYVYDPEKPTLLSGIQLFSKGVTDLDFAWSPGSDNQVLKGYNIYLNGVRENSELVEDTLYKIENLTADTRYSVAITAVDDMGNESAISNIVTVTTFATDGNSPSVPQNVQMVDSSGLAVKINWEPSADIETEVRGYDVYVDGSKYNTSYIYDTSVVIFDLEPSKGYDITVVAIDAAYNESAPSTLFVANTTKYSVESNFGMINGKLSIDMEPVSWNHGMGINVPSFHKSTKYPLDANYFNIISDLSPGSIRFTYDWGLAGTCDNYVAPGIMGHDSLDYNIGDFMKINNDYKAYTMLTVTLQEDGVFVQDPNSFNHVLEYYCGPQTTTYGAERAAAGYSDPLIDDSPGLVIEFGNEVWGGNGHCIPLGEDYTQYAEWCREMDSIIKANPYYDPEKIFTCYSGRNPSPAQSNGLNKKLYKDDNQSVDWVALSGYMGGNFDYSPAIDPGKSELDYLKNGIRLMVENCNGLVNTKQDMLSFAGEIKPIWFYEGNMTTTYYFGKFGQALIYMDYMGGAMEEGVVPSLFSLYGGQWRLVNPADNYKKLPLFKMASFFNHNCKGHVLKTELESVSKITDGNGEVINADPVGSYAYSDDSTMVILLTNRSFEKAAYIQVDVPDTLTFDPNATKYVFTSDHYSSYETIIDTVVFTLSDSMMVVVPAGGLVYVKLKGLNQNLEKLPLAAYLDYKTASQVTIECQGGVCDIDADAGTVILSATVLPADVFVDKVMWQVIGNDVDAAISAFGSDQFIIRASGECGGDGELTIRAVAPGDTSVYDEVTINISGQESIGGCNLGIESETGDDANIRIYPNPAAELVNVVASKMINTITVHDITGKKVLENEVFSESIEVDVSSLNKGIYFVQVKVNGDSSLMKKLILE